jgi:hypothetical protein
MMDYSKSGGAKASQNAPRHSEHNAKGTAKNPFGAAPDKASLVAKLKAAAEAKAAAAKKD